MSRATTRLGSLVERGALFLSDGYRTKASELGDDGLPILRVGEVLDGRIQPALKDRVRNEFRPKMGGKTSQPGDILITTKGTVGRAAMISASMPEFVYSPQLCVLRTLDRQLLDPHWLFAWVRSPHFRAQALAVAGQTDMAPYINLGDLRDITLEVPPLETQVAIAEVLGALDEKIIANERILGLARDILSALYEGLFANQQLDEGSDTTLGSVLDVLETGKRPRGGVSGYANGVPSLGAESIVALAAFDYSKTKYVPEEFFAAMQRGVAQDLDVLLYKDGGRPGEFEPHVSLFGDGFPFDRFCINEHVYRLRASPPLTQEYLYCWLSSKPTMEQMRRRGTGVAIPGLNSTAVRSLPITVPPPSLLREFSRTARPAIHLALAIAAENRVLSELRDALLPPLMAGELRVRDVEAVVEQAV